MPIPTLPITQETDLNGYEKIIETLTKSETEVFQFLQLHFMSHGALNCEDCIKYSRIADILQVVWD